MSSNEDEILSLVNASGFPLQIAIEEELRKLPQQEGWTVAAREHAWANRASEKSGFIDLVAENQSRRLTVVIEAKRVQDSKWVFLRDSRTSATTKETKAWLTIGERTKVRHFGWTYLAVDPPSFEAVFCTMRGHDPKSVPMLERTASDLVQATHALAMEELQFYQQHFWRVQTYIGVIVTTAEVVVASIDPAEISIADGKARRNVPEEVPYVRFRKQFSGDGSTANAATSLDYIASSKEQTVFVVQARHLSQFLRALSVDQVSFDKFRDLVNPPPP